MHQGAASATEWVRDARGDRLSDCASERLPGRFLPAAGERALASEPGWGRWHGDLIARLG